jgi:hypothetical protein
MPSKKKKKKKSKGRGKAVKKADGQQGSLDTQMERLKIDDVDSHTYDEDALLEEAIKFATAEKEIMDAATAEKEEEQLKVCHHGNAVETKELVFFIKTFSRKFSSEVSRRGENLAACTEVAINAVEEKYPNVWNDPSKLKLVVTDFLCTATHYVLQGDVVSARLIASMAAYFEGIVAAKRGEKVNQDAKTTTLVEICGCDDHTLVKYLRRRIPCSCLDEMYKEVKSITRTGVCHNCSCTPERSKMLTCGRCGDANYCSRACQKSDWQRHKESCAGLNLPLHAT